MKKPAERVLSVTSHGGLPGFEALEDDWRRLTAADNRYWIQYRFFRELIRHSLHGAGGIFCLALRDHDSRIAAIVPLRETLVPVRRLAFRCAELLGSTFDDVTCQASSAGFPLAGTVAPRDVLRAVQAELRRRPGAPPSLLLLGRLCANSPELSGALEISGQSQPHVSMGGYKWLDVSRDFSAVHGALAGKFRISLRSCRRNLAALGTVERKIITPRDNGFSEEFETFLNIESSGWKGTSGTATGLLVNTVPNQRKFLRAIAEEMDVGCPEIHSLTLNGRPIAAQFWLRFRSTRVAFKIGYLEEFARFQPGHLLVEDIVRMSCEDPTLTAIDFVSDAPWLDKWRVSFEAHHHHYLPVKSTAGAFADLLLRLPSAEQLRRRIGLPSGSG